MIRYMLAGQPNSFVLYAIFPYAKDGHNVVRIIITDKKVVELNQGEPSCILMDQIKLISGMMVIRPVDPNTALYKETETILMDSVEVFLKIPFEKWLILAGLSTEKPHSGFNPSMN